MFIWYGFFPVVDDRCADDKQTKNGRISMAGLNSHNIDYFAEAVDSVVRETS